MQATLAEQIEILWALSDIALYHGQANFKVRNNDMVKRMDCCGLRLEFIQNKLVRLQGRNFDLMVHYNDQTDKTHPGNVTGFPMAKTHLEYIHGDFSVLKDIFHDLEYLTPKKYIA